MRGLASFDYGDAWHCTQCHTGNDDGDHCQECHATRDGHATVRCASCSDLHLAYGVDTSRAFVCEGCL